MSENNPTQIDGEVASVKECGFNVNCFFEVTAPDRTAKEAKELATSMFEEKYDIEAERVMCESTTMDNRGYFKVTISAVSTDGTVRDEQHYEL